LMLRSIPLLTLVVPATWPRSNSTTSCRIPFSLEIQTCSSIYLCSTWYSINLSTFGGFLSSPTWVLPRGLWPFHSSWFRLRSSCRSMPLKSSFRNGDNYSWWIPMGTH
jgi:hypothetical protein